MKKNKKAAAKKVTTKKLSKSKVVELTCEQAHSHMDSRVITRNRDVALYELQATEEHLTGLRASLSEVLAKKTRLEARIAGMTNVLGKRIV